MSEEWDDDVWDDDVWDDPIIEKIIKNVRISDISADDIHTFERCLISCLEQKLEKLSIITNQMNVYAVGDHLVINDRYGICTELPRIIEGFGMSIAAISLPSMRGKTYLVSDELTAILHKLSSTYCFGKTVANMSASADIVDAVHSKGFRYPTIDEKYDQTLVAYIREVLQTGVVTVEETETLIGGVSQGIESNASAIRSRLVDLLREIEYRTKSNNQNMQNGTTEILYHRARQLGYSVEKKVNGKEVQLVLVRLQ